MHAGYTKDTLRIHLDRPPLHVTTAVATATATAAFHGSKLIHVPMDCATDDTEGLVEG